MTPLTLATLLASVMALLVSIGALLVAVRLLLLCRSTSSVALSARVSEIESTIEAVTTRLKGMNSRLSMQILRARRQDVMEPTETPPPTAEDQAQADRDRLNSQLANRMRPL
jgi:hypothetical protein